MEHRNNLAEATQRQRDAQVEPEPYGSEARLFQEHVLPSVVGWHFQGTLKPGPESTEAVSQGPLSWCGLGQLWLLQVEVSDSLWGGGVLLIPLPAQASGVGVLVACPPPKVEHKPLCMAREVSRDQISQDTCRRVLEPHRGASTRHEVHAARVDDSPGMACVAGWAPALASGLAPSPRVLPSWPG